MEEVYKSMKHIGIVNLIFGILIMLFGIASGIAVIISGAKLLKKKSDIIF